MATQATTSTTNFDVNSIVSQLMAVERQPIARLNAKEASYQAKLSAFGSVKGALSSFQTSVQGLSNVAKFQALKATSSDATLFSASAASTAVAGNYSIEINSLAQSQKLVSDGQASSTADIGSNLTTTTISFDLGAISGGTFTPYDADSDTGGTYANANFASNGDGVKSITIDDDNNTLQGIRDAINAAKMGVTATIINDGGDTPYRLALSSNNSGIKNSVKITVSGDGDIANLLAHDPTGVQKLSETVSASNANLKVDGVTVSKTSNTITDVIQGVTLTLNKETAAPAKLVVSRDTGTIVSSINGFIKAHNDLSKMLKDISAYDAVSKRGAILQGDGTVRSLQAQLRNILGTSAGAASDTLRTLSDIGVTLQLDGSLALDQAKLDKAINNNFSEIASLFTADNGYVTRLSEWTNALLAKNGVLANRTDGIGKSITDIGKRREAIEVNLVSIERRYRIQFSALDSMLTSMNSTSQFLTQQLSQLQQ